MKLTIGVTDSNGFIGMHLSPALKEAGFRVVGLGLSELLHSENALRTFIKRSDIIIHAADIKRGGAEEVVEGGAEATLKLLNALKNVKTQKKLIFLSSTQADSDSVYGKSKALAEVLVRDYSDKNSREAMIMRLPNMFGENKKPFYSSVVATFCYQLQHGQAINVDAKAKHKKINLIYIGDVVRLLMSAITERRAAKFAFIVVAAKNSLTVQKLADLLISFKIKGLQNKTKFYKNLFQTYLSYE